MKKRILAALSLLLMVTICILCAFFGQNSSALLPHAAPVQDMDGYYLLETKEDFEWFISTVNNENDEINVRLTTNLILNDTSDWEDWADTTPENFFSPISLYNGHFDGDGFSLEGYYSKYSENWQGPVFLTLGENALITDLHLKHSFFGTTYEDSSYQEDSGRTNTAVASGLCYFNYGNIQNCSVQANIRGAWSAGGIAAFNYNQISGCTFSGNIESGLDQNADMPENGLSPYALYTGGICRSNGGLITDCTNDGNVILHSLRYDCHIDYAAGGIAGRVMEEGTIQNCENTGYVECVQLAGGIAGASWGRLLNCSNSGKVHVEQADWEYTSSLITAGICASNGGIIDTCMNTGSATINQTLLSFYAPVYGIACNTINPSKGAITNCYYLSENTVQDYRQSGVYKLTAEDRSDSSAYLSGKKKITDVDTWDLLTVCPDYPGTDPDDYLHLETGPNEDTLYEVQPGDSLWGIAEAFYGDGHLYESLLRNRQGSPDAPLTPGESVTVPRKDYYLLCANDEEGIGWSYCVLPSGESCPTHFIASKPINWYYGNMYFDANSGLVTMWPKDKEAGHDAAASDIRIFYCFDGNPDGDFFAADWDAVQESYRQSASACCGDALDLLRFYRYRLDNGENLYGCSFRLYRQDMSLKCAAFYRIQDGFLAEYIGIEPTDQNEHVLERVRYLAARIDNAYPTEEIQNDRQEFYGRENWDFPQLHNPFATALKYDPDAECNSYMLFTGSQ